MGVRISTWVAGLAVACAVFFPLAVWADEVGQSSADCGTSVTAEILGILRDAGNIDQARYEALCARARGTSEPSPAEAVSAAGEPSPAEAVSAAGEPSPAEAVSAAGEPAWNFKWSDSFRLTRSDGAFKLKFGGRAMLDSGFIWEEDGLRDRFEASGIIKSTDGNGVEFRRARLFFGGTIYDRAFFKVQYDFAQIDDGDNPDFKDVYMGLKKLGPVRSVQVGNFKEPFTLQEWTSSKYITFLERGLNNVFFPGRNVGVMGMGNAFDKGLLWQLGLFRVSNDQGFAFDGWDKAEYDLAARLSAAPIYRDGGSKLVHLGVGYIHRFNQGSVGLSQRPETHLAQKFVDTKRSFGPFDGGSDGRVQASDSDLLNLEAAVVYGPFSAQVEWTFDWVQGRDSQQNLDFWGGYLFASYFLTGEHRNYEKGNGRFGRVRPKHDFNPAEGDWGAWEIAARYSVLDLSDQNVYGGKLWDVTAGLNWYLFPNLRWMVNYVYGDVRQREVVNEGGIFAIRGAANILETRFQVDF
ncbi:MAG: porin [Myxococcota bacterium]|nr:porin [Myxococcota bacterium]